ncbi:MAG: hypothetical protein ACRD8W_18490, partial [Nitrososphaeraceae archaeon]
YHCHETAEKNQDYGNSNSIDSFGSIWLIPTDKRPRYPALPEYICNTECRHFHYSTHDRHSSNYSRNCYGSNSSASGVQFFIEEERKHYRLLYTYVFEPLSHISLYNLNQFYPHGNDVIPHYRMPIYHHFDDAVLHMKKDGGNLNELVKNLSELVFEFNNSSENANSQISLQITNGIQQAGLDENNERDIGAASEINRQVRTILTRDIFTAPTHEMYDKARNYNASLRAEGLQDSTHKTIIDLIRNENIIELIWTTKSLVSGLEQIMTEINQQAIPISRAIDDEYYGTRVDCCPTYWTLLKRFV